MSEVLNPIQLEKLRTELIEKIFSASTYNKIILYTNYFDTVLTANENKYLEAFLPEFLDDYLSSVNKFEVSGTDPEFTTKLLLQLKTLTTFLFIKERLAEINNEIARIEKQKEKLIAILEGKEVEDNNYNKAFFPLIDRETSEGIYGIIDSITVQINHTTEKDKFIIVPSEQELEKKIEHQVHSSWKLVLSLTKIYLNKTSKFHEVIISFDKKIGFYEGNSLGIALTLSFLEQLLKFYNPTYVINIKEYSAFTGGVDENGKILETGEEIIKQKVKAIFFSEIKNFVIPKFEETYAYFALTQLQKEYPNKKLKLIPVEDINDITNRRDLVEIKKQKLVVRSGKFIKKNLISAVATVLLAILFTFLYVIDLDDNPAYADADGQFLFIKNKNGKTLWSIKHHISLSLVDIHSYLRQHLKVFDTNGDEKNEIVYTDKETRNLICYDYKQQVLWKYKFVDTVNSIRENLNGEYLINIIDTLTFNNKKNIFLFSTNGPSFGSAIFCVNAATGKRLPGTLWCSGHIYSALIKDLDNNGEKDILAIGADNGFEEQVLFAFKIDTLTSFRPSTNEYTIKNYPVKDFISYIRFPKTDFTKYYGIRLSGFDQNGLRDKTYQNKYLFAILMDLEINHGSIGIWLSYNLKDFEFIIDNQFRVSRDTLVAQGKLKPPFTDTKEYTNILKESVLYYQNGKWVKREELK